MKKNNFLKFAVMALVLVFMTGISVQAQSAKKQIKKLENEAKIEELKYQNEKAKREREEQYEDVAKNDCQKKAEEKPMMRAYGIGEHFKEMTAKNIAEAQARGEFARAIAASIKAATREESNSNVAYDGNRKNGEITRQENSGSNDLIQSIADEEVKNTTVILTCQKYNSATSYYKVSVCLEYNESLATLASNIQDNIQKLAKERKLEMNIDFEKFRKDIENELEKKNRK